MSFWSKYNNDTFDSFDMFSENVRCNVYCAYSYFLPSYLRRHDKNTLFISLQSQESVLPFQILRRNSVHNNETKATRMAKGSYYLISDKVLYSRIQAA